MLEDCEQDGEVERGQVSGLVGHGQEFGNFLSVVRILWDGFKQQADHIYIFKISLWLLQGQERR